MTEEMWQFDFKIGMLLKDIERLKQLFIESINNMAFEIIPFF